MAVGNDRIELTDKMTMHLRPGDPVPKPPKPRSEEEIMSGWKGGTNAPAVSICCITYNHGEYIEDTLNGFLCQVTDFPFEILINDDASTDKTPEILRKYAALYPRIIKLICQVENQYTKGFLPNPSFNFPRARGNFIAMCEGDDSWLSETKLQRQYEIAKDQSVSVVFHSAVELNMDDQSMKLVSKQSDSDGIIPLSNSVKGRGAFMPTASLFFRANIIKERLHWFENDWPIGDFFLQMILSYEGKIYYINEPMCLYRRNAPGSWTDKQKKRNETVKYQKAMVKGILVLYKLLGDCKEKHLLADPTFFYARGVFICQKKSLVAVIMFIISVFDWDVSWSFKRIYLSRVIAFPFSMAFRKIRDLWN